VLAIDTEIRFFPVTGFSGVPAPLDFIAVDGSFTGTFSGATSSVVNTSVRGGTTPFSNSVGQLGILVREFGVSVTPVTGLQTTESGTSAVFEVVLDGVPAGDVTISVNSSDVNEGIVSTNQLRFDSSNWSTPQQVLITGVDDSADDGDQTFSIELGPATSTDAQFNGLLIADVDVVNIDDDDAGIVVSKTSVSTSENGSSDQFSVRLSSQPTGTVVLALDNSNVAEATLSVNSLTFTPSNWNVPQTVTVTGVDDDTPDSDKAFQVLIRPTTTPDPAFAALAPVEIDAENASIDLGPAILPDEEVVAAEEEVETELIVVGPSIVTRADSNDGANAVARKPSQMVDLGGSRMIVADLESTVITADYSAESEDQRNLFSNRLLAELENAKNIDPAATYNGSDYSELWLNLNELDQQIEDQSSQPHVAAGTVASVASVFTVGYLAWLIRGGHLLLGLLSQLPAWSSLDLLTVLAVAEEEDDEGSSSLESLVTNDVDELEERGVSEEVTNMQRESAPVV
jgi:hypothetical protein